MYAARIDIELSDEEVAVLLQALEDAAVYRDARSHVLQSAVRRRDRRSSAPSASAQDAGAEHRRQARAYQALALKLRKP
jgi:hypothetical protein